jgi:adenylate cyclase
VSDELEPRQESEKGLERARRALKRGNRDPALLNALRTARELLPGDASLGEDQSITGERTSDVLARRLAELNGERATASRQAALGAIQVWQHLADRAVPSGHEVEATILFTDLVGFSEWVLEAGDDAALDLLREVAKVVEPIIRRHKGRIVKYLGDGHMAAFGSARPGLDAALEIQEGLVGVEVLGHRPQLRAGLHCGHPQRLHGDYLGADVNVAARISAAAGAGEVLVSDAVLDSIDASDLTVKRLRGFRAKGTPSDLRVFSVSRS